MRTVLVSYNLLCPIVFINLKGAHVALWNTILDQILHSFQTFRKKKNKKQKRPTQTKTFSNNNNSNGNNNSNNNNDAVYDYDSPNISLNDDNIKFDFSDPDYQPGTLPKLDRFARKC